MEEEKFLQAVRALFDKDEFIKLTGAEIVKIAKEETIVKAKVNTCHLNGNGCVQGGMLYTLADFAFALHANALHPACVTQAGQISYLRPAYTSEIIATAREIERAGHSTVSEVVIKDADGNTVCVAIFNGFVKDVDKEEFIKKQLG